MLALILENVGEFLRHNDMKLTQFLILDAEHGMQQLLLGNLYKSSDGNGANLTSDMYIGGAKSISSS